MVASSFGWPALILFTWLLARKYKITINKVNGEAWVWLTKKYKIFREIFHYKKVILDKRNPAYKL